MVRSDHRPSFETPRLRRAPQDEVVQWLLLGAVNSPLILTGCRSAFRGMCRALLRPSIMLAF